MISILNFLDNTYFHSRSAYQKFYVSSKRIQLTNHQVPWHISLIRILVRSLSQVASLWRIRRALLSRANRRSQQASVNQPLEVTLRCSLIVDLRRLIIMLEGSWVPDQPAPTSATSTMAPPPSTTKKPQASKQLWIWNSATSGSPTPQWSIRGLASTTTKETKSRYRILQYSVVGKRFRSLRGS